MPPVISLLLHPVLAALFTLCFFLLSFASFLLSPSLSLPLSVIFIMRLPAGHFSITWPCHGATVGHDYSDATMVSVCVCVCVGIPASQPFLASGCRRCLAAAWRMSWAALRGRGCWHEHTVHLHSNTNVCAHTHTNTHLPTCAITGHRCSGNFSDSVVKNTPKPSLEKYLKSVKLWKETQNCWFAQLRVYFLYHLLYRYRPILVYC